MKKYRALVPMVFAAALMVSTSAVALAADPVSVLNDLIETAKNGQEGYRTAAQGVDDPSTKALFEKYSAQRGEFAAQLKEHVRALGGDPDQGGSVLGAAHRGWINIKAAVSGKDEAAILAECKKGDESAVKSYEDALKQDLPADVKATIQKQADDIRGAYDKVVSLEARENVDKDTKDSREDVREAQEKADRKIADAKEDVDKAEAEAERDEDEARDKADQNVEKDKEKVADERY